MSKQSLSTLKGWFEEGQRPTGDQFSDVFDSFLHLDLSYDLTAPAASGVVATQEYVNNIIDGLDYKQEAFCSTTANITLSGLQNLDGTTGAADVRVLVQNQTTQTQNGIYLMKSGSWVRTSDADTGLELQWAVVTVANGTTKGGKVFRCGVSNIVIGTTNIVWTEWSLASYTAGDGLALSGNQFSVDSTVLRTTGTQTIGGTKSFANNFGVPSSWTLTSINTTHFTIGNNTGGYAFGKNTILSQSSNCYYVQIGGFVSDDKIQCSGSSIVDILRIFPIVNNTSGTIAVNGININPSITNLNTGGVMRGIKSSINSSPTGGGTAYNLYIDGSAPNYLAGDVIGNSDIITNSGKAFYLGDKSTDGTWRIRINTNDLVFERRESGAYVQKGIFTA